MKTPVTISFKHYFLALLLSCCAILGTAYLLEYWGRLHPCPLCLLQRYVVFAITALCLIAYLHNPKRVGQIFYLICLYIFCGFGILFASRQVWLQQLPPDQRPPCAAELEKLLSYHSVPETLKIVLTGSGECGVVEFQFLGLSLASWSLVAFILILISGIGFLIVKQKR